MLFAVHVSDGVLTAPWLAGGFALAAALMWLGACRLRDDEVPRIAILTAAFFVSSLIHIRVGPTSIHLLLTGLIGVLLGLRAPLAIFTGLLLQAGLMQHGGYYALGVNTCVMTVPALLCFGLFRLLHRIPWTRTPLTRALLVGLSAAVWFVSGAFSISLLWATPLARLDDRAFEIANASLREPWMLAGMLMFAVAMMYLERRLENRPEFPLGFLIGEISVLLTAGLNCAVLIAGGETNWPTLPVFLVVAHLPFAVVEGVILGFVVGFLTRVKPDMLVGSRSATPDVAYSTESKNLVTPLETGFRAGAPSPCRVKSEKHDAR